MNMKSALNFPISILYIAVLVSCSSDSPRESESPVLSDGKPGGVIGDDDTSNNDNPINIFFGFLDGDGSSNTYIDMPVESSATHLFVGRWHISKVGIDENNDGNIKYYNYQDFDHKDCGSGFLQFNNDIVFENTYYKNDGTCTLYSEIDNWELIEANRFKIYVYDNIYLVNVTESELILKYDWRVGNSLYSPMQVYYYYDRIQSTD